MLEAKLFVENRMYPRILTKISAGYRVISEQKEIELVLIRRKRETARTKDISLGGLYILANHGLKVGQVLRLYISLQTNSKIISPIAEVVWTNGKGGGLRFISLRKEEKDLLGEYLDLISKSEGVGDNS